MLGEIAAVRWPVRRILPVYSGATGLDLMRQSDDKPGLGGQVPPFHIVRPPERGALFEVAKSRNAGMPGPKDAGKWKEMRCLRF